ncbi:MAG: DUF1269 domain-containing protein [Chloroflexi bacterium]|nr:DUF1269 domain-containing protein [Chloroflexota bacterium]
MANKNNQVIIACFSGADKADAAANQLKVWDKANDAVKLGGIGILVWEDGKIKTRKVGGRAAGAGAKWGMILGITTGILSGGVTLIGGAVAGAASGAVLGALFHKGIGLSDDDKAELEQHLQQGGAALVVMADEDEVAETGAELGSLGGDVASFEVPQETMEKVEAAEDVQLSTARDKILKTPAP